MPPLHHPSCQGASSAAPQQTACEHTTSGCVLCPAARPCSRPLCSWHTLWPAQLRHIQHTAFNTERHHRPSWSSGARGVGISTIFSPCASSWHNVPRATHAAFAPGALQSHVSSSSSSSRSQQQQHQHLLPFPDVPDPQQQLLCEALHLTAAEAQLILLSCPDVSTLPPAALEANWRLLQQLLPLPRRLLLQAVLQVPSLLPEPQKTLQARLAESARVLGLPPQQLKGSRRGRTVQLHWRLLVTPWQQLQQQVGQLVALLGGLQQQQVSRLVCLEPRLLVAHPAQLLSTVEALEQVCGCHLGRLLPALLHQPWLLVTPADEVYRAAAGLQQLLRLSEDGLTLVLRRAPAALLVPSSQLLELLQELPAALAVNPEVAADILLQEPCLLVHSPGALLAVLRVVRSRYKLTADALLQVVQFDPSILDLSPGPLDEATGQFQALATTHPSWTAEYRYLMSKPVNVARALRIEPLRLQRLVFLSRQGLAGTISLRAALTLSGRKFVSLYPHYQAWLGRAYSSGNPPKRYAAWQVAASHEEESDDDAEY